MVVFRSNFRDLKEWQDSTGGCMKLNTCSNEAAKQYDASLTQMCGWYEDDNLGGLAGSLNRMLEADPEFVLGRALDLEISLTGAMDSPRTNKEMAKQLADLNKLAERKGDGLSEQEKLHVEVVNNWARGELKEATRTLERIVCLYPEDVGALKLNQDTYFILGTALQMRNSLAGSLRNMSSANPLKGYVHGMFAFALEESNIYPQAQSQAEQALALIPFDTWAIHNYAHCLEMQAKTEEGLRWMLSRRNDWLPCQSLACHQNWHTALFHINLNQFDQAVELLDTEVLTRCAKSGAGLDVHDASSMLYRMELVRLFAKTSKPNDGKAGRERWQPIYDICKEHNGDHFVGFNDAHYMMTFLGMDDLKLAREFIESLEQDDHERLLERHSVVKPLLEGMYQFKVGNFAAAVELIEPIRFDIVRIGGSHAQRDVFEQLLLVSALKSDKPTHQALGRRMLAERETFHGRRTTQTELLNHEGLSKA